MILLYYLLIKNSVNLLFKMAKTENNDFQTFMDILAQPELIPISAQYNTQVFL